ncbi:hypothetical protein BGX21_008498 [Mortierella sp. AD011]|nr:hypothetical protein BGX21_008498 [Mortierella sp. AD011]
MLDSNVVSKNGNHIRVVKNLGTLPQLDMLLQSTPFMDHSFQHRGIVRLEASVDQVFKFDPNTGISAFGSSLLMHFPNLESWLVYFHEDHAVPIDSIKTEVKRCCTKLTNIDTWSTKREILRRFIADAFENLTTISFAYSELSEDVVMTLLFHSATIISITAFRGDRKPVERLGFLMEQERDHFQKSGRTLQMLMRYCPNLEVLEIEPHLMNMDHVEQAQWGCKKLKRLRTTIKDLDTTEKIERALLSWTRGKKLKGERKNHEMEEEERLSQMNGTEDSSIEGRVARHLLAFENLEAVWLGTWTWYA